MKTLALLSFAFLTGCGGSVLTTDAPQDTDASDAGIDAAPVIDAAPFDCVAPVLSATCILQARCRKTPACTPDPQDKITLSAMTCTCSPEEIKDCASATENAPCDVQQGPAAYCAHCFQ